MTVWIIEPRDPLIVRDGRPFGPNPGARARSLTFPFPSTIAGGVRTRAGQDGNGRFDTDLIDKVEQIQIRGPLLVKRNAEDQTIYLAPAPADALLFDLQSSNESERKILVPLALKEGLGMELPKPLSYPVGLPAPDLRKPFKDAPNYWHWSAYEQWLIEPKQGKVVLQELGINGPTADRRMHVAIDPGTLTGLDGALFMTSGLTFAHNANPEVLQLTSVERLALAAAVTGLDGLSIREGYGLLGGERRLMHWQKSSEPLPELPEAILERVATSRHCRLILLTPAFFDNGWLPDWLLQGTSKIKLELKAAAVGQPQTVSGWNLVKKEPKLTRRLAQAGSVFYLELDGDEDALRQWVRDTWLQCISDHIEDCSAGFGLAAIGTWSGNADEIYMDGGE